MARSSGAGAVVARLRSLLPSATDYRGLRRSWRGDLVAGVTVGVVALPLALAFGVSSGAGAESGLITAIIAGAVAAVFGGSNVQVSGPTGAMVVVLGPVVAAHGVAVLPYVCVLAGVFVVAAGVLRLGRAITIIPWPVIEGFTLGIAVIIFLQQVPAAIGSKAGPSTNALVAALQSFGGVDGPSLLWALGFVAVVVACMLLAPRVHRHLPGSIIGIVVATAISVLAGDPGRTIGALPAGLPGPVAPGVSWDAAVQLAPAALTVAALAAIESLLSARVAASMSDTGPYDADRELVGQGLASVASGFFGGMPATGAIARTAVNVRTGARTRVAAFTHAVVLLVVVLAAGGLVSRIPLAALAGVLIVTSFRMISAATIRTVVTSSRADAIVFAVTALLTIGLDLIYAVLIGILAAGFFALRTLARSSGVHREALPGPVQPGDERIGLFRLEGALFFGAAERVLERVRGTAGMDVAILRMSQLQILDATGAQVVTELITTLERDGVTVLIKGIRPGHLHLATTVGVIASLRHRNHLFDTLDAAAEHARSHVRRLASAAGGAGGPAAEG